MSTRDERAEATRSDLLRVGRDLFAERGFTAVGTEEIVTRAGLTRGALYHHFGGKQGLFQAVLELQQAAVVADVGRATEGVTDPVELLEKGIHAFLDACTDSKLARIVLVDGPTVLGWTTWREIDERYTLGLINSALTIAMDAGLLTRQPVAPLGHMVIGALSEAALVIAHGDDPDVARAAVEPAAWAFVGGLLTPVDR